MAEILRSVCSLDAYPAGSMRDMHCVLSKPHAGHGIEVDASGTYKAYCIIT
jgi:hypothetical protein